MGAQSSLGPDFEMSFQIPIKVGVTCFHAFMYLYVEIPMSIDGSFSLHSFLLYYCYCLMLGTAAMLLVIVWKPHIGILSISTILRYTYHLVMIPENIHSPALYLVSFCKIKLKG